MLFRKEFEHMLLYGDEDGECKYTSAANIHSMNFTINLNRYLNLYVFFIGTFVWFKEILAYFINNSIEHPSHITLIASASYTASFAIGYFNLITGIDKKCIIAIYILLMFAWFKCYATSETKTQLQAYDMVSSSEFEHM